MRTRRSYIHNIIPVNLPNLPVEQLIRWSQARNIYLYTGNGNLQNAQYEASINGCTRVAMFPS